MYWRYAVSIERVKYNFARKLASLDPRVTVSNPDQAVKMFQEVLQRLIETR